MLQKFDSRNADLKVFIKDRLYPRDQAKVSVFDSVVQGGDAVWEGQGSTQKGLFALNTILIV